MQKIKITFENKRETYFRLSMLSKREKHLIELMA